MPSKADRIAALEREVEELKARLEVLEMNGPVRRGPKKDGRKKKVKDAKGT